VLIAPLVAEYFGPENANTGMNTIWLLLNSEKWLAWPSSRSVWAHY
jgi:hypothetical protein